MQSVLAIVVSYLLGSISFSFIIAKYIKGIDIRKHGSGNAGATNTLRVLGKGPAIAVLSLDVLKGMVAIWIAMWASDVTWLAVICGLAVIAGHNWPVFFGFRGGKGIATTIGAMATLCFLPALFAGIIAIISIVFTRYVSLGSLIFAALLPVFIAIMGRPSEILIGSIIIGLFAFIRHRSNIVKIARGKENKLGAK
ncbi:glycerol-3-phosphate 1-O-acyltransferase [Paenibacillus albiflavus]|uniref:Glycerol-3-phosphate acyltransferase n=1 Tax=Paenibacillus albiflavus TaxID=2545760 RepID=A0A4R4ES06_9BACL|nr:glycerol-3-phosphate 1-O-acyltransferase PlsY [Paenibacillus albiflavus]TCZ81228.1 glycerol-3-phosphate 1-O-acyltransferase [Paenibacillus albiflavus]